MSNRQQVGVCVGVCDNSEGNVGKQAECRRSKLLKTFTSDV